MNLREQVAKSLYEWEYSKGYWDNQMPSGDKVTWLVKADAIFSLIIKELKVIGDEEILQARLNRDDTTGFIVDDAERRIAQSQHDHHIKQLRGE